MRIAVSADSKNGLDSVVSPHFGRCPYFIVVDVEAGECGQVREVENPYYGEHQPGQVPAFIHSLGADVMLTGGMGYRAITAFQQHGIATATGAFGTVRQAVERYLAGQLSGAEPCAESREHGHGMESEVSAIPPPEGEYERDELGRLRDEADMLRRQLAEVADRLDRLSGGRR